MRVVKLIVANSNNNNINLDNNNVERMNNVDNRFKSKAEEDFSIQDQTLKTTVASITTRRIEEVPAIANQKYVALDMPEPYRVDASPFIARPFYVGEVDFPSTAARHSLLTTSIKFLPGDAVRANPSLTSMFKIAALGRPEMLLNISLAGTISHAGCILVGVLPPLPLYPTNSNKRLINTILSGPHAFLHANEATSVALEVPFYCNSDLTTTDMDQSSSYVTTVDLLNTNGNYATLVFYVLNPLQPSTGASTSLKIVIEACFKTCDLFVPTPRYLDWTTQSGSIHSASFDDLEKVTTLHDSMQRLATEVDIAMASPTQEPDKKKKRKRKRKALMAVAPTIVSVATLAAVVARLVVSVVADEPAAALESIHGIFDYFEPQSGFISGLFDSAAKGLKKIAGDAIDAGRTAVRDYTGLHNPNIALNTNRIITTDVNYMNLTDGPQYFEKLDPYAKFDRIISEPIFGTSIDEMAMTHIAQKKQYIGTITVRAADAVGKRLWVRPISPFQGGMEINRDQGAVICANNLELLHSLSRAWSGGLKLTIQSVMNNKQQAKLKIIKMYNPSTTSLVAYPVYNSVSNAPSHLLEFTAGGQTQEVSLPYLARNKLMPCATNMDVEPMLHGLYYIFLAQPLANSESSPTEVSFNLYISGDKDLTFYGYVKSALYHENYNLYSPTPSDSAVSNKLVKDITYSYLSEDQRFYEPASKDAVMTALKRFKASNSKDVYSSLPTDLSTNAGDDSPVAKFIISNLAKRNRIVKNIHDYENIKATIFKYDSAGRVKAIRKTAYSPPSWLPQSGPIEVMNEPQIQDNVTYDDNKANNLNNLERLMPTLDIRPLIRRMYKADSERFEIAKQASSNFQVNLSGIVGEDPSTWAFTPVEILSRMYYGKSVGFKFRIDCTLINEGESNINLNSLNMRATYLPQDLGIVSTTKTVTAAVPNLNSFVQPLISSVLGYPPTPLTTNARQRTVSSVTFEFIVPDTSFFKFLGGPDKFRNFAGSAVLPKLAISDFGSVILQFVNTGGFDMVFQMEMYVSLTDESRMGYHSMAPPFIVYKHDAYYLGTDEVIQDPAVANLNPFTYFGGIPT